MTQQRTARFPSAAVHGLLSIGFVLLLYFGRPFFLPLSLAVLLVLLLSPLVSLVQRSGLRRVPSVLLVVLAALLALGAFAWLLTGQFADLAERLPQYRENLHHRTESLRESAKGLLGRPYQMFQELGRDLSDTAARSEIPKVGVTSAPMSPLDMAGALVSTAFTAVGAGAVVLLMVVFLLIYQSDLRDRLTHLAGVTRIHITLRMVEEAASHTSRYLLLQTVINALYGSALTLGMFALGVPNALLWGTMGFLLRYIPYLGPLLASAMPLALSAVAFEGWGRPLLVGGFLAGLEFSISNGLEPVIYARGTGLAPLAVVISAIFWTCVWGAPGLILAVPITSALVTLGRHLHSLRFLNVLLGSEPNLEPEFRLYHRLLDSDIEAAVDLVEEYSKDRTLAEVYDQLLVPALALAEQNRHLDETDDLRSRDFFSGMNALLVELEERPSPVTSATSAALVSPPPSIVLVPVADEADELCARMLSRLLLAQGLRSRVLEASATTGDKAEQVERGNPDILCLSAVPPAALLKTRYLLKRILARYHLRDIIVGVWNIKEDGASVAKRISSDEGFRVRTTLNEACAEIRERAAALNLVAANHDGGQIS